MATRFGTLWISLALGCLVLVVYVLSPIVISIDSRWSIPTAVSIFHGKAGDLTEYKPRSDPFEDFAITYCKDRPRTVFPVGVSLLALPAVAVAEWLDPQFPERLKDRIPVQFEQRVAAFYAALAGVIFFWVVFSQFGSVPIATAATLIFAFSTSMWSTSSRGLWQHGPLVLMLCIAMLLLLQARLRPHLVQYAALPLAAAFVIRPMAAIPIAVLSAYVLLYYRPWFVRYLLWAALIAVPWGAFNFYTCGTLLPGYYAPDRLGTRTFQEALLGTLFSPSRGLFVFSPVLLLAFSGFALAMRKPSERPLYIAFGAIAVLHWIAVSRFWDWWGGHSFGPRYMTDIVPFLAFFVAFNFEALSALRRGTAAAIAAVIALLAGASVFVHARGATVSAPILWNVTPVDINRDRARLWDWSDPQFLRRLTQLPAPPPITEPTPVHRRDEFIFKAPLSTMAAFNADGQGYRYLGKGWSQPESWGVWSDGPEASLRFRLNKPAASLQLRLEANGFEPEAGQKQTVAVLFNDRRVATLALGPEPDWFNIVLPLSAFGDGEQTYSLDFLVGRPTSPAQRGMSADRRLLGIGLRKLIIQEP